MLVMKEGKLVTEGLAKHYVSDNFITIGTFLATGLAVIVWSLLKPLLLPASATPIAPAREAYHEHPRTTRQAAGHAQ